MSTAGSSPGSNPSNSTTTINNNCKYLDDACCTSVTVSSSSVASSVKVLVNDTPADEFSSVQFDTEKEDNRSTQDETPAEDGCVAALPDCKNSINSDATSETASNCESRGSNDEVELSPEAVRDELTRVKAQLLLKEEQYEKLTKLHDQTGLELQDLTASLFEEANKMVQEANIKRMATEKRLEEANTKIEVLQAEVTALKALVLTSTPSAPNPHLNPQIDRTKKTDFSKGHRRSTSHHNFIKDFPWASNGSAAAPPGPDPVCVNTTNEVEPLYMDLFLHWKREPCMDPKSPFLACIVSEDISPCLRFANESLSKMVFDGVFNNTLTVEPILSSAAGCLQCSLTEMVRPCRYCLKLDGSQTSFSISQAARNRVHWDGRIMKDATNTDDPHSRTDRLAVVVTGCKVEKILGIVKTA